MQLAIRKAGAFNQKDVISAQEMQIARRFWDTCSGSKNSLTTGVENLGKTNCFGTGDQE